MNDIPVVIPVGPNSVYLEWLPECIESILAQTHLPKEIIIIDDGANLNDTLPDYFSYELFDDPWRGDIVTRLYRPDTDYDLPTVVYYKTVWTVGVADAFNFGVSLAKNDLVFMLGSDDRMYPTCLEECVTEYEKQDYATGWYNVTVEMSSGEVASWFNNTAAVTKSLWKHTGGFSPAAFAAPDALLLSCILATEPHKLYQVKEGTPLCWLREHPDQDTKRYGAFYELSGVVRTIRNMETERYKSLWKNKI
jgi:muconolactone delta-isomerase